MNLSKLVKMLTQHPEKNLRFILPTGTRVPAHVHVTEVARVDKRFIDCGGTFRNDSHCQLQLWFADDTQHRLSAGKLLKILDKSASLLEMEDIEVEHEAPFISHFPLASVEVEEDALLLKLEVKHTACLAQDKCGVQPSLTQPLASIQSLRPLKKVGASCCS